MVRAPGAGAPPGQPTFNNDVLVLGFNAGAKAEADSLSKRGNNVTLIRDSYAGNDKIAGSGAHKGKTFDLSTDAGVDQFAFSLGLPAAQTTEVAKVLKGVGPDARDEMGQLARVWAGGEKGGKVPSRVVLSGHSGGSSLWGDDNGSVRYDQVRDLAKAMPKAAAQVEDLHLAACYAGSQDNADKFKEAFPNLKTQWAYHDSAPGTWSGAQTHLARWDGATRGRKEDLDRSIASGTRKGDNVATWNRTKGFDDGQTPLPIDQQRGIVQGQESLYQDHLQGKQVQTSPGSGPLRDYYNDLQRLLRHPDLPAAERPALEERRDQAIRMIYYSQNVAPKFAAHHGSAISQAYTSLGLNAPDFAKLSRSDALAAINALDAKAGAHPSASVAEAQRLLHGLRDLDPSVIPAGWV